MNISRINTIKTTFSQSVDYRKMMLQDESEKTTQSRKRTRIGFIKKDIPETEIVDTFEQKGTTIRDIQVRNKINRIKAQRGKTTSFKGSIEKATPEVEFEYVFKEKEVKINTDNSESIMTSFKPVKTFYSTQQMPKEFLLHQIEGADNLTYFEMSEDKPFGKTLKVKRNDKDGTAEITEGKLSLLKKDKEISTEKIGLHRMNFNEFVIMLINQADSIGKAKIKTEVPLIFQ